MKKSFTYLVFSVFLTFTANAQEETYSSPYKFIENKGQIINQNNERNPNCLFLYNGNGLKIQLRKDGFSYEVTPPQPFRQLAEMEYHHSDQITSNNHLVHRVDIFFEGMNSAVSIEKENESPDYINYFTTGTPEGGITNVHHYGMIRYKNVYNNIDFEFEITEEGKAEYYWVVRPGGKVEDIKQRYNGANSISLNREGKIQIETSQGNLEEEIPASYYSDSKNERVDVKFQSNGSSVKYKVGSYDLSRTLVIDPTPTRSWATYYGGNDVDYGSRITTDSQDNIVMAGTTSSSNAIASSGAYQTTIAIGASDAFIAKFNSSGARQWATYYGGEGDEHAYGITTDNQNNIIITGNTSSSYTIASSSAYQIARGGNVDVFIAKFNTSGARQWATYYGGSEDDFGDGITTDSYDNIIIIGTTQSKTKIASSGAYQTALSTEYYTDAFIAKFNSSGTTRWWATYYGGVEGEFGGGIITDSQNNIVVTGETESNNAMSSSGAYQTIWGGSSDAFVAKFNASGVRQWATYYGGTGYDSGADITIDGLGNIIITGITASTTKIASSGAYQTTTTSGTSGGFDAFIAKFNASGSRQWATYYGGSGHDHGTGVTTDSQGNIIIVGSAESTTKISSTGAYQTICGGSSDAFIAKFNTSGARQWGSYYGGSALDYGMGITTDSKGSIIISGRAESAANIAGTGAYDVTLGSTSASDAFIAKFVDSSTPTYCSVKAVSSTYEWIEQTIFGSVTTLSGNNGGYGNYTSKTIYVTAKYSLSYNLKPKFSAGTEKEYWKVWIDYNQDGDFTDAGEECVSKYGTTLSVTKTGSFIIPATAKNGNTRMRVSMKYGSYPTSCESFSYGEIEDYTVNITGGAAMLADNNITEPIESDSDNLNSIENINNYDHSLAFVIFPNPAKGIVNLNLDQALKSNTQLIIYNSIGNKVYEQIINAGTKQLAIDVNNFANGLYSLHIGDNAQSKKFIVGH